MAGRVGSRAVVVLAGLVAAALAACGQTDPEPAASGEGREIDHVFGTTTVEGTPERVVALGVTDADPLIALGITPIAAATYDFYADGEIIGPWARELADGTPELIVSDSDVNVEEIAAMRPDLIVAISSGIDEATYDQLSGIAPVIARPDGTRAYTATRDEATEMIASAVGREAEGRRLVDEANDAFAAAVRANPEFEGATGSVVLPFSGVFGAFTAEDARGQVLDQLGFVTPPRLAEEDPGDSFFIELSQERLDLLEGDVLVALIEEGDQDVLEDDPLFQRLDVVERGDLIVDDGDLRAAMTYNSVLSAPFAVEGLTPLLARALATP